MPQCNAFIFTLASSLIYITFIARKNDTHVPFFVLKMCMCLQACDACPLCLKTIEFQRIPIDLYSLGAKDKANDKYTNLFQHNSALLICISVSSESPLHFYINMLLMIRIFTPCNVNHWTEIKKVLDSPLGCS